jgi:hypothetical protein
VNMALAASDTVNTLKPLSHFEGLIQRFKRQMRRNSDARESGINLLLRLIYGSYSTLKYTVSKTNVMRFII